MTRRRDDHDHYGRRAPDRSLQFAGTMFDANPEPDAERDAREASIDARFREFHRDNPHVLAELERRISALVVRGVDKVGIRMVWEAMRYDALLRTASRDFKLNDHFTSRYVRLILDRHPEWTRVLETRELRSA